MPQGRRRSSSSSNKKNKREDEDSEKINDKGNTLPSDSGRTEGINVTSDNQEEEMVTDVSVSKVHHHDEQIQQNHCNSGSEKCQADEISSHSQYYLSENIIESFRKNIAVDAHPNYRKHVEQLIKMATSDSHQLAVYLTLPENRFEECLNGNMDLTIASLWLFIISNACNSTFCGCNKHITRLVIVSEFWIMTVPSILSDVADKDDKGHFIDLLFSAVTVMTQFCDDSLFQYIESIPLNQEVKEYITNKFDNLRIKMVYGWTDDDSAIDNNRSNENVLPLSQDLDDTYPLVSYQNTLIGSYSSVGIYLDSHFYLMKENMLRQYRTAVTMHRDKKSSEAGIIHTDVVVVDKHFYVDGIHIKLLFPSSKHLQQNSITEDMDLCLSDNDFYTFVFAAVISIKSTKNGKYVRVRLLDSDPYLIAVGHSYTVAKSVKFGSIHRQILDALKAQQLVALCKEIVYVEKPILPPSYVNSSTTIDLAPVIMDEEKWAGVKNSFTKEIQVLSSWSTSIDNSVSPSYAYALEEVLQRELSLVEGCNERGKSFAITLIKLLNFNKVIWRRGKHRPLLVICESSKMFEELNADIQTFCDGFVPLHENVQFACKSVSLFEKTVQWKINYIQHLLEEINFCENHPLKALETYIAQQWVQDSFGKDYLRQWLKLTEDMDNTYSNNDTYKKIKANCRQRGNYTEEFFEKFTCDMLKNSNEMSGVEASAITEIQSLHLSDRWRLAKFWMTNYTADLTKCLNTEKNRYHHSVEVLQDLTHNAEWKKLSRATIVSATVCNVIKHIKVIKRLDFSVMIVVEADKIPEPYLIPLLGASSLEHLILIGNRKQLSYSERTNDFSVSMYDRLLANGLLLSDLMNETEKPISPNTACHTLPCGHSVTLSSNDVPSDKCQEPTYVTLDCGHQITVPCFEKDKKRKCEEVVESTLSCNHILHYKCCDRDIVSGICTETREVPLPCNHTVEIHCRELKEKREEYYSNGCYKTCSAVLDCGHMCIGKCSECVSCAIHKGCGQKCDILLDCGHTCQGPCNVPCPPCGMPCEWKCSHGQCPKLCGEICEPCTNKCTRTCAHHTCDKMCWEKCDEEPCRKPCALPLKCGHKCRSICSALCLSLCPICDAERYQEMFVRPLPLLTDILNECLPVLELQCGHIFFEEGLELLFDEMVYKNKKPVCPTCKTVLKNEGFVGSFVKKWFLANHEKKIHIKNLMQTAVKKFRFNPIVIKGQLDQSNIDSMLDMMDNNATLSYFILGRTNILYIIILVRIGNIVKSLKESDPGHETLVDKCQKLTHWIRESWNSCSFEQLESCSWEVYKLHQLCSVYEKQQKIKKYEETKKSLAFIRSERICRLLQKTTHYNESVERKVQTELTKICEEKPSVGSLLVKRILPVTKEKYCTWFKGNITLEELSFEAKDDNHSEKQDHLEGVKKENSSEE